MPSVIRGGDNFDSQEAVSGTAKAWVNFNGTGTVAIRDSHNVSSITDDGTGLYRVNFTNNMANVNYMCCSMGKDGRIPSFGDAISVPTVALYQKK